MKEYTDRREPGRTLPVVAGLGAVALLAAGAAVLAYRAGSINPTYDRPQEPEKRRMTTDEKRMLAMRVAGFGL